MKSNYYTLFKFIKGVVIGVKECQQVYCVMVNNVFNAHLGIVCLATKEANRILRSLS